ncbi:unnamed protein product [Phytomonas sp. Hart1]|nr:unnamed protein product [Phytomonas sp. Hart1]|eukprot:CCW66660.1 unnamed protein product [Phytomonas sp. isolate Hart1]
MHVPTMTTHVTARSHKPTYSSSRGQNGDLDKAPKHQRRKDETLHETCASEKRSGDDFRKGEADSSKVPKLQKLHLMDELKKFFFSDPAISGPMMSANYLATKSSAHKVKEVAEKPKEVHKSVPRLPCGRYRDGYHTPLSPPHGSDSGFASSGHWAPRSSASQPSDRTLSNHTPSRTTTACLKRTSPVKLSSPSHAKEAMEGRVKCHGLPTGGSGRCSNVLDLRHRGLVRLPCLHMADTGSPHGSGEGIASRLSVLNLSNNHLETIASEGLRAMDGGHRGKYNMVFLKEPERHLSPVSRPCSIAIFRNVSLLDLTNNSIHSLDGIEALPLLRSLRLTRNAIISLSSLWCAPCVGKLDMLDVSENRIEQLVSPDDVEVLKQNPPLSLLVLRINSNRLYTLPQCLSIFKQLRVFRARGNKLASVPDAFPSPSFCPKIRYIDLSANLLSEKDQQALQRRISALEKITTDTLHDGSRKRRGNILLDLSHSKIREKTPLVPESIDTPLSSPEVEDAVQRHCNTASSVISPIGKVRGYLDDYTAIEAAETKMIPPDREHSAATQVSSTISSPTLHSSGVKNNGNLVGSTPTIALSSIPYPKRRRSSKKEPPQLKKSPVTGMRLSLEGPKSDPVMLATNVWYIDLSELLKNVEKDLLAAGGRCKNLIPRLPSSMALSLWDSMPRLGLVYCQGESYSPATLIIGNITAPCTTNPHCIVLIYQILRSISMLSPDQYNQYLKCSESQYSEERSTTLSFTPRPFLIDRVFPPKTRVAIKVYHLFHPTHPFQTSLGLPGVLGNGGDLWAYLRWRRAWEGNARVGGLRADNAYARARVEARSLPDLAGLFDLNAEGAPPGPGVSSFPPIPLPWASLYDLLGLKSGAKKTLWEGEGKLAAAAEILPSLRDTPPSVVFAYVLSEKMRVWPVKTPKSPRTSFGGCNLMDPDGTAQDSATVANGPLDYVGLSLKLLSYVHNSIQRTKEMANQSIERAQISCPLVSYSRDAIYTARRAALAKERILVSDSHKGNISDAIFHIPSAKFLP